MLPLEGNGMDSPFASTAGEQLVPQGTLLALSGILGAANRGSLQAPALLLCVSPDAQRGWEAAEE